MWTGIALHTTPGVSGFMHPVIALTAADVEMDLPRLAYGQYDDDVREALVAAFPRSPGFKGDLIQAFHEDIGNKPDSIFGKVGPMRLPTRSRTSTVATSVRWSAALIGEPGGQGGRLPPPNQ